MESFDLEIERECPVCNQRIRLDVTVDVDASLTRDSMDDGMDPFLDPNEPCDPYKTLIPNISVMNQFVFGAKCGDEAFYCDGHIFFIGTPPFVFRVTSQEDTNKDWSPDVNAWRSGDRVPLTPTFADNGRVCFERESGNLVAPRNHVDVFRIMYPNCTFEGGQEGNGVITVQNDGKLVGGFMPINMIQQPADL